MVFVADSVKELLDMPSCPYTLFTDLMVVNVR